MRIAVAKAKAQFSELLRHVEAGEEIELTRYGQPVARIVAANLGACRPLIGALKGRIEMQPDYEDLQDGFTEAMDTPIEPPA